MKVPFHQTRLYEIHSRIFCIENDCKIDTVPESFFESFAFRTSNEIWLMGIWAESEASQGIARSHQGLRSEFLKAKNPLFDSDILSSPYAIYEYNLNPKIATVDSLSSFRQKLHSLGKQLILDFVPNHMAIDTPYLDLYPNCFYSGDSLNQNHFQRKNRIYAYGKDPYFDGWTDTVQWDFSNPETVSLHIELLLNIAKLCDGVRCDMAMLALPDVFLSTHGRLGVPYWEKIITTVKEHYPNFKFYAEAYWNREYDLQVLGFDATYDKTLYDRLANENKSPVLDHLLADLTYQNKSIRFIENHDEERALTHFGSKSKDFYSLLTFLPGVLLSYFGQELGNRIKLPVQLGKRDLEIPNQTIVTFYNRVFETLKLRSEPLERYSLEISYFTEGKIIAYLLTSQKSIELLLWNPMPHLMDGKVHFPFEIQLPHQIENIVTGEYFPTQSPEDLKNGFYFKLEPGTAQWFTF